MVGYLLDTSTCVAIFRGNRNVAARMNEVGVERCFISPIVVAELYFGAYRSGRAEEKLKQIHRFVEAVHVLPFEDCLLTYAKERARLWDIGEKIEDFDLLIGCAAKAAGLTVVTHNVKHFNHIKELEIEDWVE
ncbi:MAG: PIN domain-containing protein [Bacteroidales bacterium]|nr:PIN domain-containing protein [Bacteroidales bacterium]